MKTIKEKSLMKKLGAFIDAEQGDVKNEMILKFENGSLLQSYDSKVAARCGGMWYFFRDHDYSNTTNRHVIRFCGMNMPRRRKALEDGSAIYVEN